MAETITVLTFIYSSIAVSATHFLARRLGANRGIARSLDKLAGVFLIGFGVGLALTR